MVVFTTAMGSGCPEIDRGGGPAPRSCSPARPSSSARQHAQLWVERESTGLMIRTATGRFRGATRALGRARSGIVTGVLAIPILAIAINPLTALLGAIAHTTTCSSTHRSRRSPVGARIGAIPARSLRSLGWTAATGSIALPGGSCSASPSLADPAFLAIAIYSRDLPPRRAQGLSVERAPSPRRVGSPSTPCCSSPSASSPSRFTRGVRLTPRRGRLGRRLPRVRAARGHGAGRRGLARRTMLYSIAWLTA